jgi:hypothetical protein
MRQCLRRTPAPEERSGVDQVCEWTGRSRLERGTRYACSVIEPSISPGRVGYRGQCVTAGRGVCSGSGALLACKLEITTENGHAYDADPPDELQLIGAMTSDPTIERQRPVVLAFGFQLTGVAQLALGEGVRVRWHR